MNTPIEIDAPGSHLIDSDDLTFSFDIIRQAPNGERVKLTIEAQVEWDGARYYGLVPLETKLPGGWMIEADSVIMLTPAEQHAINCSDQVSDWRQAEFEADEEARQDQADRERDFIREGSAMGLIRSF